MVGHEGRGGHKGGRCRYVATHGNPGGDAPLHVGRAALVPERLRVVTAAQLLVHPGGRVELPRRPPGNIQELLRLDFHGEAPGSPEGCRLPEQDVAKRKGPGQNFWQKSISISN